MKITKRRLKQIITEELMGLSEVDNNQVQIATAQDRMENANDNMKDPIQNLSDKSMQGAMVAQIDSILQIIAQINDDVLKRSREEIQMPEEHVGGIEMNK